jgi:hypothetical protein
MLTWVPAILLTQAMLIRAVIYRIITRFPVTMVIRAMVTTLMVLDMLTIEGYTIIIRLRLFIHIIRGIIMDIRIIKIVCKLTKGMEPDTCTLLRFSK